MPSCPACGAPCDRPPLQTFSNTEAAQHFVLAEEYPDQHRRLRRKIASLWNSNYCTILSCATCRLKFSWPFVAGDGEFYNLAYPFSDYPKDRWEFRQTLAALGGTRASEGSVLEIGAGFGYFLKMISPRIVPPERVIAIEYNDSARARLAAAGFNARGEEVRSSAFDNWRGEVDAIFMFQVLEHMDRLDDLFARLRELARPGCSLFVAVPNHHRIEFNAAHGSLLDMPPNHISQWTEQAFLALGARCGWSVVECRTQPMQIAAFIRQDLIYSHMRRAQRSGSLANRIRSRPRSRFRIAIEGLAALLAAPSRLSAWRHASLMPASLLGESMWVHMRFERFGSAHAPTASGPRYGRSA